MTASVPSKSESHVVRRTWVVAVMSCGACPNVWEQPHYQPSQHDHWVCPQCLHGAQAKENDR